MPSPAHIKHPSLWSQIYVNPQKSAKHWFLGFVFNAGEGITKPVEFYSRKLSKSALDFLGKSINKKLMGVVIQIYLSGHK